MDNSSIVLHRCLCIVVLAAWLLFYRMGNNLWTCASVVLMTVGGCLAIGEMIGHDIGTIIHSGSVNGPIDGTGDGKSIEDPPLFIPAKPFNP